MFIGIYLHVMGKTEDEIVAACYNFASAFEKTFSSLRCFEMDITGIAKAIRRISQRHHPGRNGSQAIISPSVFEEVQHAPS